MSRIDRMHRAALEAAQRRRRIAVWVERMEHLERTPARTPEERQAKAEALDLMSRACPR